MRQTEVCTFKLNCTRTFAMIPPRDEHVILSAQGNDSAMLSYMFHAILRLLPDCVGLIVDGAHQVFLKAV